MADVWEESSAQQSRQDMVVAAAGDIAKAAIIYAGDHGEVLPATQSKFEEELMPYMVARERVHNFTYTFKGEAAGGGQTLESRAWPRFRRRGPSGSVLQMREWSGGRSRDG